MMQGCGAPRGCQGGSLLCLHATQHLPKVEVAAASGRHNNKHDPAKTLRSFGSADTRALTATTATMSLRTTAARAIRARQEDEVSEGTRS